MSGNDSDDELRSRIDRLEAVVETQGELIAEQRRRIDRLQDEGAGDDAGTVEGDDSAEAPVPLARRSFLVGTGLVGLLAGGAGTAAADPQGQIGTRTDPLTQLHTAELVFDDTDGNGNRFALAESSGGDLHVLEGGTVRHRLGRSGDLNSEGTLTENASLGVVLA